MPILNAEPDIFPDDLLSNESNLNDATRNWFCIYTLSRREKDLMRKLFKARVPFYSPVVEKRYRSPKGRMRTSHIPLLPNYVFVFANGGERETAWRSNCIVAANPVEQTDELIEDLSRIQAAVRSGAALTPEAKLGAGDRVRVRNGPFAGFEGIVIRREGKTRLLLDVRYLQSGVSMELDEGNLEPLR